MAKLTGPAGSFGLSGQLASQVTYRRTRSGQIVQRYATPTDPRSTAQQEARARFAWAQALYTQSDADYQYIWARRCYKSYSTGIPVPTLYDTTPRGLCVRSILPLLYGVTDLSTVPMLTPWGTGLPAPKISVAPGVGQLTITVTPPDVPSDWVFDGMVALLIPDQSPLQGFEEGVQTWVAYEPSDPIVATGLTASIVYRISVWCGWFKGNAYMGDGASALGYGVPL